MSRSTASARAERTPATIRAGVSVSATACPSRRNSGFQVQLGPRSRGASAASLLASAAAVPTGVVDLPATRQGRASSGARASTQA